MNNWFPILSFALNLIILTVSACCFIKIMKNDLTHVQRDLGEIKSELKEHAIKMGSIAEDVAHLKGKLCNKRKK
jgi:hypothetical protein